MTVETIIEKNIAEIKENHASVFQYLTTFGLKFTNEQLSLSAFLNTLTDETFEDIGIDKTLLLVNLEGFLTAKQSVGNKNKVSSITIIGGYNKAGEAEDITITLESGSITSIVGPTGSGKSRLLADIEWMAQMDTPTQRKILVNNEVPDVDLRFSLEHKLVAQLSQNMNFVMDATVEEFISLHAESRMVSDVQKVVTDIIAQANELAGEQFGLDTPLTALSGGQSRALMIADTAILSTSPVVLIDEIENAGIDRKKALQLLVKQEKIVLMATHDPILALMAERRLVIKNGGIAKVIETSQQEKDNLIALEKLDNKMLELRNRIRRGERVENVNI